MKFCVGERKAAEMHPLAWCLRKAASETNGGENCVGYSANSAAVRKCTVQGVGCKKMSTFFLVQGCWTYGLRAVVIARQK